MKKTAFENLAWYDFICPFLMVIGLLVSLCARKTWLMVDSVVTLVFGVGLVVYPRLILEFQASGGKFDVAHLFLARNVGALLIGSAITWFLCRKSKNGLMFRGLYYSRLLSCTLLLIAQGYSLYHLWNRNGIHFNEKFAMFSFFGVMLWWFGSMCQLLFQDVERRQNALNGGLLIDHFVLLLAGILMFAFPSQLLKFLVTRQKIIIDGVHVCLLRSIAALTVGHAMSSYSAAGVFSEEEQKSHVLGRMISHLLVFILNLFGYVYFELFTGYQIPSIILMASYIIVLVWLYFSCNDESINPEDRPQKQDDYSDVESDMEDDFDGDEGEEIDPAADPNQKKTK